MTEVGLVWQRAKQLQSPHGWKEYEHMQARMHTNTHTQKMNNSLCPWTQSMAPHFWNRKELSLVCVCVCVYACGHACMRICMLDFSLPCRTSPCLLSRHNFQRRHDGNARCKGNKVHNLKYVDDLYFIFELQSALMPIELWSQLHWIKAARPQDSTLNPKSINEIGKKPLGFSLPM